MDGNGGRMDAPPVSELVTNVATEDAIHKGKGGDDV